MAEAEIAVEVVYAQPDMQRLYTLRVAANATVRDAIEQSNVLQEFAGIDLNHNKIGIFGKVVKLDQILRHGDRVEIYRPLLADPKLARKQRAAAQNLKMKKPR